MPSPRAVTGLRIFCAALCFICCNTVRAAERASDALDALVAAYPDALARHDGTFLYWKDGTRMPVGAAEPEKSFEQRLRAPSILDQFHQRYPAGAPVDGAGQGFRSRALSQRSVLSQALRRLPARRSHAAPDIGSLVSQGPHGESHQAARRRRAAGEGRGRHRQAARGGQASRLSDRRHICMPHRARYRPDQRARLCGGDRSQPEGFRLLGLGAESRQEPRYRNRMPLEIVEIFERHGFIWGGRWYHYDTMHFEYRPELLPGARR